MHCKCCNKTCFVQMTTLILEQLYFVVKRMTGCFVSVSLQTLVGSYQPVCLLWCNENNDAWTDTEPTAAVPLAVPTAVSKLQNRKHRQSKCFLKILTLYLVFVMLLYERSRTEQTYNPPVGSDRSEVWCVSRQVRYVANEAVPCKQPLTANNVATYQHQQHEVPTNLAAVVYNFYCICRRVTRFYMITLNSK